MEGLTFNTLAPPSSAAVIERGIEGSGGYQTWEAAKRGGFRGWFYFPNLEPDKQMTRVSLGEMRRRSNWLYNNIGLAKSIINRTSRYEAGTGIWPKPTTTNKDWNKTHANHFHDRVEDSGVFDVSGDLNFYTAQISILRHFKIFGDHFGMPSLSAGGTPQMYFVPGYAVDNADIGLDQSQWTNGVRSNEFGRALQYRVIQNDRSKYTDVSADDMWRFRDHSWNRQSRAVPMLHHAAKHLFDIDDILYFEKAGVRLSSQIGYVLTVAGEGGGPRIQLPGAGKPEQVDDGSGGKVTVQKVFGGSSVVPELNPGEKLEMIQSNRTPASFTGFLDYLVRDICWGADYADSFLWFLGGIGGAPLRYVIEDAGVTIEDRQQNLLIPQFCRRFYRYFTWQEMKAGRVEYPGPDWWRADYLTGRKITVDKQREGRLDDDRLATGKVSGKLYYGQLGLDEEDVEDDIIASYKRRKAKCEDQGLDFERVFRPPPGTPTPPDQPVDPAVDPEDPAKPTDPNA